MEKERIFQIDTKHIRKAEPGKWYDLKPLKEFLKEKGVKMVIRKKKRGK